MSVLCTCLVYRLSVLSEEIPGHCVLLSLRVCCVIPGGEDLGEEAEQEKALLSQLPNIVQITQLPPNIQVLGAGW